MISVAPVEVASPKDARHADLPHVLLILDQFSKTLGGGERVVLRMAALLPEYGYRVSVLTFAIDPESLALESPPCPVYILPLQRTYNASALRAAMGLRNFLKEQHVEIVQTFFESSDLWGGLVAKTTSSVKLIWSRRDMGILRTTKHRLAYRMMAAVPDAVFAVSARVRNHCIEVDGIDPDRVSTIYNGLNISDLDQPPAPATTPAKVVVTTVGNIRPVKGHDVFIRAAAVVLQRHPNVSFTIAGEVLDHNYFLQLQVLIRDLKLSDHFRFVGGVTDLNQHLSTANIFVLPSRSEGFSNAIVEAMAASLPVVATEVGGNAEAVIDGVNGFIVAPSDPAALAAAIVLLLDDPRRAKAMGLAGRGLAKDKFSMEAMMNRITSVYGELLSKE